MLCKPGQGCGKSIKWAIWSMCTECKIGGTEVIETGANKPTWVGPGTVIAPDGANLWVSMLKKELWRVARELQCRPATSIVVLRR